MFGIGRLRPAPGTWGTLATLPIAYVLMLAGPLWMMAFILLFFPISVLAAEFYFEANQHEGHDSKSIVVDEVIGFTITMLWLPMTWQAFVFGFFIFRFLDILKPFPIGYLDRKIKGGIGVIVDDVAAGAIGNLILQFLLVKTSWLGVQVVWGGAV